MSQATMDDHRRRHSSAVAVWAASLLLPIFYGCGGGGSGGGKQSTDAEIRDARTDGNTVIDAGPDAGPQNCGNGVIDDDESCDGSQLGGQTCSALGLPDGQLGCNEDCTLDTSGCAQCDDGICSDGETSVTCPQDCGVVSVAAGKVHTCAVLADGSVWCWGARSGHRMGGTGDVRVPVRIPGIDNAVAVAAGWHHTCVRTDADEILCWGANGYGQVGAAPPSHEVFPPVQVAQGRGLTLGPETTCVRATPTELHCWGRVATRKFTADAPFVAHGSGLLAVGGHHICFVMNFALRCWGRNSHGQLGVGDRVWRLSNPGVVNTSVSSLVSVGAGTRHTCMSASVGLDTGMKCWGNNEFGQLGLSPGQDRPRPTFITDIIAQKIDGGERHTCAKESPLPAPLYCWGDNARGQLGNGTVVSGFDFQEVATGDVADFDVGAAHTCAILPDQTMRCWGDNRQGQIGNGSMVAAVAQPTAPWRLGPQEEVTP